MSEPTPIELVQVEPDYEAAWTKYTEVQGQDRLWLSKWEVRSVVDSALAGAGPTLQDLKRLPDAAVFTVGAEVREAVPVLPGGPPRWLDAKGPGRYLVIPIPDKET